MEVYIVFMIDRNGYHKYRIYVVHGSLRNYSFKTISYKYDLEQVSSSCTLMKVMAFSID